VGFGLLGVAGLFGLAAAGRFKLLWLGAMALTSGFPFLENLPSKAKIAAGKFHFSFSHGRFVHSSLKWKILRKKLQKPKVLIGTFFLGFFP